MDANSPVVIAGAGIIGASIAFRLTQRHRNVTIVDANEPGRGATWASYAWINSRDKEPREYHDLNRRSLDMWPRFARDLDADLGLRWGGEMRWSATGEGADALLSHAEKLRSWGYPVIGLTKAEARAMEPGVVMEPFTSAVHCAIEGHVDTQRVVRACLNRVQQAGAQVITNSPISGIAVEPGPDGRSAVRSVTLKGGRELPCEVLILAAGYETAALAAMAGIEFAQRRSPGVTVVTEPLSPIFRNIVCMHTPRDLPGPLMNIRQFADGSVMVHGGNHNGSVGDSSDSDAQKLMTEIARFVPSLAGTKVRQVRRGMRPMPEDGFPVIGFAATVPNLYMAVTHSGVTLAALIGEFAALEVLDAAKVDILAPYRLERFAK
jgi:glycine/D-amino acid oxidase-like deaminating enzyme